MLNLTRTPGIINIKKHSPVTSFDNHRLYVEFKNGYALSIVRGPHSYGGNRGLFEIAPFNPNNEMDGSILGIEGDDVEGYLTAEQVYSYIKTMTEL